MGVNNDSNCDGKRTLMWAEIDYKIWCRFFQTQFGFYLKIQLRCGLTMHVLGLGEKKNSSDDWGIQAENIKLTLGYEETHCMQLLVNV